MAQRIRYGGAEFLLADVVADAVLDYALTLSREAAVDVVDLRTRRVDGTVGRVRMLIGSGIPLACESTWDDRLSLEGDPEDEASAEAVRRRMAALHRRPLLRFDGDGGMHAWATYDDL